jgi:hypothetical protein
LGPAGAWWAEYLAQ